MLECWRFTVQGTHPEGKEAGSASCTTGSEENDQQSEQATSQTQGGLIAFCNWQPMHTVKTNMGTKPGHPLCTAQASCPCYSWGRNKCQTGGRDQALDGRYCLAASKTRHVLSKVWKSVSWGTHYHLQNLQKSGCKPTILSLPAETLQKILPIQNTMKSRIQFLQWSPPILRPLFSPDSPKLAAAALLLGNVQQFCWLAIKAPIPAFAGTAAQEHREGGSLC